eukprot:438958_1
MSKEESTNSSSTDICVSGPTKKYPTFRNYDSNPIPTQRKSMMVHSQSTSSINRTHQRTTSAPPTSIMQHLQATPIGITTLDTDIDTDKTKDFILQHCPQLLPDCNCQSCHPPTTLSPIAYNIPFQNMQYAHSLPNISPPSSTKYTSLFADARHGIAANCEQSKNTSLIQTIGMGIKNSMPRLLNILNDINSRLLLQEYKSQNTFYTFNNSNISEEEEPNSKQQEDEEDDDDVDVIDGSIHQAFVDFSNIKSLSPITISKSCGEYLDRVPLLNILNKNHPSIFKVGKSWNILNKMPIHQALHAYQDRISKPLNFAPRYLIKDSISHYIGQISLITVIVQKLVREHGMPLQVDVVILSKDAVKNEDWNDMNTFKLNDEKSDGESEENKNNYKFEEKENINYEKLIKPCSATQLKKHKYHHYEDDIGDNIMSRFLALPKTHHKDHFAHFAVGVPPKGNARKNLERKLDKRVKLLNKTQHGRYVIIIDREGHRTEKLYKETWLQQKKKKQQNDKPKHSPFLKRKSTTKLLVLDGTEEHKNDNEKDDCFYFFQPPKPYGDIIEGIAMSEAMHMNTLDFLIPALKTEHCPIGARHLCGGKMFCISFHMMSKDEQKCYLYIDQSCMKIDLKEKRPITDLMRILPHYFKDDKFIVLDIMKRLKDIIKKKSEINQFKQCVEELKFDHEEIEDDIAG